MSQPKTHRHHYVPVSLQKRFLPPGQTALRVLDMKPDWPRTKKQGPLVMDKGPKAWFYEEHLYTTRFLGQPNDEIETALFGDIDRRGIAAIRAVVDFDQEGLYQGFTTFFEYMDALRLRTPKGLLWLRGIFDQDPSELLITMQRIRLMHCCLWAEGVHEILSATDSPLKFIVSDHPVTLFNPAVHPVDPRTVKPRDPRPSAEGTRTLFPLDRDHLFVVTHLNYAKSRGRLDPLKDRPNPRFFDNTLVRWDSIIRKRTLKVQQVAEVNHIIKTQAHRFVAAADDEALFPHKQFKLRDWSKLGGFLMPDEMDLFGFGGEMTVVFKDGSHYFQDAHGRRPQTQAEFEEKVQHTKDMQAQFERVLAADRARKEAEKAKGQNPPE